MKRLFFVAVALLILGGCTKIEQMEESYFIEVTHPGGNTKVVLRAFEPIMVEIDAEGQKDAIFVNKLPQIRQYSGYLQITHREIKNVIWAH